MSKQYKMYKDGEYYGFVWFTDDEFIDAKEKASTQNIIYIEVLNEQH